jgi:hypothetical protein
MTGGKPGEDLGIGWGVQEDPDIDAMGVNDARHWEQDDETATEDGEHQNEPLGEREASTDPPDDHGQG